MCWRSSRKRGALRGCLILLAFQEDPARLREERLSSALPERADFGAADLIDRIAHVLSDVKPVQDVEGMPGLLGDDFEIRLPHVAADESERGGPLPSEPAEEPDQGLGTSVLADPQQALARRVDLVDEREELAPALPMDLVDADRANTVRST